MTQAWLALVLLFTGLAVHYGWEHVDPVTAADAWNIGGAFGRVVLLGLVCIAWRSWPVLLAACWWAFEETQVVVCGVWWLVSPWPLEPGQSRCSAWLGIPLGAIGLWAALCLAVWIHTKGRRHGRGDA